MRMRYVAALISATCLASAGGMAYADFAGDSEADATAQPSAYTEAVAVTLVTGDHVYVLGDDSLVPRSSDGEPTHFYVSRLSDGDRIVVPGDAAEQVRDGELDVRLFNVDALLRAGYTDAREVPSPDDLEGPDQGPRTEQAADFTFVAG
ncbi:MAG: hypothetical protein ACRDXX_20185 [Stackebrandtia sp.]